MNRNILVPGLCLIFCSLIHAAPLGTGFTYQGRLNDGSVPASGIYHFVFELFDAASGGTLLNDNEREDVTVANGLFTVTLDFGSTAFNGQARWLQINVQTNNGGGFTTLTPRQQLFPAPNSLFAATAGGVPNGAITTGMLAPGAVTTAALANGAVTASTLANNAVTTPKIADGSVTSAKLAPGTVITNIPATTNNLALGTASLDGRLDVYRTGVGTPAIQLLGGQNLLHIFSDDGLEKSRLDASPGWGQLQLNNNSPVGQRAAILTANATGGGSLTLYNSNGTQRAQLFGGNAGGELSLNGADGLEKVRLQTGSNLGSLILNNNFGVQGALCVANFINGGGLLTLNNTSGQNRVVLDGGSAGGKLSLLNTSSGLSVDLRSQFSAGNTAAWMGLNDNGSERISFAARNGSTGRGGLIGVMNGSAAATVLVTGDTGTGNSDLSLFNSAGTRTIRAQAGASQISTFGSDGLEQIRLWGASFGEILLFDNAGNHETVKLSAGDPSGDSGASLRLRNASGSDRVVIQGQDANGGGAITIRDASGTETVTILGAESSSQGGKIRLQDSLGNNTVLLDGDVNGEGWIQTQVLRITGGADLSEQFDIHAICDELQPGMVVCIDSSHSGQLVASTRAYDSTVAGIISGAGGVKPGMLMGQAGSVADGQHPVALTGRVYALADASSGAIEPGDLLTTSDLPGHAMKVADPARAQGAIIGKAMSSLKGGKGLVLVLVSLQ